MMITQGGTISFVLDDRQLADLLDGDRAWLLHLITIRTKRLVRAARRRGERI